MRFLSTLAASALGTLIAFGVIFFFLFFFLFAISLSADTEPQIQSSSVLVVRVDGEIPEQSVRDPLAEVFQEDVPAYDLLDLKAALRNAAADDRIEGVWLQLRSASSGWATLQEVRRALVEFQESGKPLIASAEDFGMGEKEYFLATAADSIFAAPLAPFEFNGFFLNQVFFKNALEKFDVDPQIVRAGKYKSAVEPFLRADLSEDNREQLSALLEDVNSRFMEAVAERRSLDVPRLQEIADESAVLTIDGALIRNFIDGALYRNQVEDLFKERLGYDADDDLVTTTVPAYSQISASDVGIEPTGDGEIAIVYGIGAIVSGDAPELEVGADQLYSNAFIQAVDEARTRSQVEAIVIRIDSPGGSAAASEVMWNAVQRAASEKPVVVSMGNTAASGGYYIAAPADTIVADPLTITGSIGVFGLFFDASGFFEENLGVTFDAVRTSPLADMYSGLRPVSEREQRLLESSIDTTYQTFLRRVATGRGLTVAQVDSIAQGRVWTGTDAKEVGLVDVLGGLSEAVAIAGQMANMGDGPYRTRILPRPQTFFERFNSALTQQARHAWMRLTASPLERAWVEQQAVLRRLARDHGTVQARLPVDLHVQ